MIDNKNLIMAVVLSIAILVGFETFFAKKPVAPPPGEKAGKQVAAGNMPSAAISAAVPSAATTPGAQGAAIPSIPGTPQGTEFAASIQTALKKSPRIQINTPRLSGSIALKGAIIDDLTLVKYRENLDPDSPEIVLLTPKGTEKAYYAQYGWVAPGGEAVPGPDAVWHANQKTLTPESPVTLTWSNGQGLKFSRTFTIDKNYMFSVTQKVENASTKPASLHSFGLISRRGTPETTGFYILHEGPMGVANETLQEISYDDLKEKGQIKETSKGGWIGFTDKYWLAALVPDQNAQTNSRYIYRKDQAQDVYQVDYLSAPIIVAPGKSGEAKSRLFAGAKEVTVIDAYNEDLSIDRFDLAIDFGLFYFLTKPIFYALLYINGIVLNFGISIILLTLLIKLAFFPLANKSYTSMSAMKKLAPQMKKMRERYADDKTKLNEEMMALYKREKVNPASGCLPILIQIPVFFALYKVLFINIEMRHAPFFGWIKDLSAADPTSVFNLFGLIPWTPPDFLMIGVWPLIMGISMFLQQKLNPQPTDPMQAKIFLFLPLMFTFLLARFPAGLVIYWAVNNILSMAQQWLIMRRMGISGKDALK